MRREGWEHDLHELIERARARPFARGTHDCTTWAADAVRAVSGVDLSLGWRGSYGNARGAARTLRRAGYASLAAAVTDKLGPPLASALLAQRGDIVTDGVALGVCVGAEAAFVSPKGLVFLPISGCTMAWRV